MRKNKDKIKVHFVGHNSEHVTGSMTLIEMGKADKKILIEAGLIQENMSLLNQYRLNTAKLPFKPKDIDYIFIGHGHIDHIGALCRLKKLGFNGTIVVPKGLKELMKVMLLDSAKIMGRDAMDLTKKLKKFFEPIYSEEDVYACLNNIVEYDTEVKIKLDDDIEFEFIPSGHIVRAYQICLWLRNGSQVRKIGVTSDLGQISEKQYYVNDFKPIGNANLLISECTYCDKKRAVKAKDREKDLEKIKSAVYDVIDSGGSMLFPCFALQRMQVMITVLYELFHNDSKFNIPIYVASPLSKKICDMWEDLVEREEDKELWNKVLNWDKIHFIDNFDELMDIYMENKQAIFCAANGMMMHGYSLWLASKMIPNSKNILCFVGYSVEGSVAYKIKNGQKSVTLDGKQVPCRCRVINLGSFSSHMQYPDLINYLNSSLSSEYGCNCQYDTIALVHGDQKGKIEFGEELRESLSKKNRSSKVVIVNKSTVITL